MKTKLRNLLLNKLGYWFYKSKHLPIGTDIAVDLKNKLHFPINIIFDIGANIGQTTMFYREVFPESKIYSFEPIPKIFEQLKANLLLDKNVHVFQKGIGSSKGHLKISLLEDELSQQHSFNHEVNTDLEHVEVEVTTIDDFISENTISKIDLLKIDTEGFEIEVLKGAKKSIELNKIKAVYLEVGLSSSNKQNSSFTDLFVLLESYGFTFFGLYEISHLGINSGLHYGNALFIHQSEIDNLPTWQLS